MGARGGPVPRGDVLAVPSLQRHGSSTYSCICHLNGHSPQPAEAAFSASQQLGRLLPFSFLPCAPASDFRFRDERGNLIHRHSGSEPTSQGSCALLSPPPLPHARSTCSRGARTHLELVRSQNVAGEELASHKEPAVSMMPDSSRLFEIAL